MNCIMFGLINVQFIRRVTNNYWFTYIAIAYCLGFHKHRYNFMSIRPLVCHQVRTLRVSNITRWTFVLKIIVINPKTAVTGKSAKKNVKVMLNFSLGVIWRFHQNLCRTNFLGAGNSPKPMSPSPSFILVIFWLKNLKRLTESAVY